MSTMSIIVPVYNVEKWLRRCIDSILNQTFRDFELILVDDGSPDNCPSICDEYAAKDNRIKVIHQKNRGLGEARNSGLKVASGTYILFCDSDDAYVDGAFEKLMANVEKYPGADLYCFDYVEKSGRKHYPEVRLIQNKTQEERLNFCSGQLAHNMGGVRSMGQIVSAGHNRKAPYFRHEPGRIRFKRRLGGGFIFQPSVFSSCRKNPDFRRSLLSLDHP